MTDNLDTKPIMNLHSSGPTAENTDAAEYQPSHTHAEARKSYQVNAPKDMWPVCVGDALQTYNKRFPDKMVFLQNDRPVWITTNDNGKQTVTPLDRHTVGYVLASGASWYVQTKGDETINVNPSHDLAEFTLTAGKELIGEYVPVLKGLTDGIIIDEDWRVVNTAGYDPKSKYYLTKEYSMDPIPEQPTVEQVAEAKANIRSIFKDFCYRDAEAGEESVNYQNIVMGLVTAAIRPAWKRALPLLVINKSSIRIGGSLLAQTIGTCATGNSEIIPLTFPKRADEYETRINTAIIEGKPYYMVDNVTDKYNWFTETLLTQSSGDGYVALREFRKNTSLVTCPPKTFFVFNGINIDITKDVCGRVIPVYLENKIMWQDMKWDMTNNELKNMASTLYPSIIWSIATIHNYWVSNGSPAPTPCTGNISEYAEWYNEIGGMLQHAGYTHILENLKDAQTDYNEADNTAADLLNALGRTFPDGKRFTTTELQERITEEAVGKREHKNLDPKALINNVPEEWFDEAIHFKLSPAKMGRFLSPYMNTPVNGSTVILRKKKIDGVMTYSLEDRAGN